MAFPLSARRDIFQPFLVAVKQQSRVSPWRARLALLMLGFTVLLSILTVPFMPTNYDWIVSYHHVPASGWAMLLMDDGTFIPFDILLALLGTMIVFAQSENRIGWLLVIGQFFSALGRLSGHYALYTYMSAPETHLPLRELAFWFQNWLALPSGWLLYGIILPLLFPDGHLPSKRWRWLLIWGILVVGLETFFVAFHPNAYVGNYFVGIETDLSNPYGIALVGKLFPREVINILTILRLVTLPIAALSLVVRYIQADRDTRQQIKWFGFELAILIVLGAAGQFKDVVLDDLGFVSPVDIATVIAVISLPIFLGISIFKYRLYDIDIIINRTLVYGILTVGIIVLYMAIVLGIGEWLQVENNLPLPLIAVGLIAIIVNPLREHLQRLVNQLMFGERDNPYEVLSRLDQQLATAAAPQAILDAMVETVATALKLPYVAFQVRQGETYETCAAFGKNGEELIALDSVHLNEQVGRLQVSPRTPGGTLSPKDWQLLRDISHQAGAVAYTLHLIADLRRSRERLVTTREEERRRLRRDLHDGLGPTLASQTLDIDRVIDLIPHNVDAAVTLLQNIQANTRQVVTEIRRVVYGLRPPALDELGLVEAVRTHVMRAMQVGDRPHIVVEAPPDGLPPLPAAVDVTAYRMVMEALTNVVRHAQARTCLIRFKMRDRPDLQIIIEDDGVGLPEQPHSGVGLVSMRERVEELGGSFGIQPRVDGGTRVTAELPLPQELIP